MSAAVSCLRHRFRPPSLLPTLPTFDAFSHARSPETHVELKVASAEPGARGDSASGGASKRATLETGLEIRVPLFIKEGEKVRVSTENREFAGRA
jgi:hypothetical protein